MTTATITWPENLRPALRASKSRQETVGFRESPVTSGPSFVEPLSEDNPEFYDVSFIFTPQEARVFQAWLRVHRMKTLAPFFMFPIVIEDPNVDNQEARFTVDGYPQLTSNNSLFTYSARLLIRNVESLDLENDEFILKLGIATGNRPTSFSSDLDILLNGDR